MAINIWLFLKYYHHHKGLCYLLYGFQFYLIDILIF